MPTMLYPVGFITGELETVADALARELERTKGSEVEAEQATFDTARTAFKKVMVVIETEKPPTILLSELAQAWHRRNA